MSIVTAHDGTSLVGSAILTHTGAVVGVGNVWVADAAAGGSGRAGAGAANGDAVWVGIARAARQLHPSLTLVGHEDGAALLAPLAAGFREIGPLRVWVR